MNIKIISFGGGINSVAMTIMLYEQNEICPCVFADTLAEHPETYYYMDYFEKEFMSKYGQKIIRLSPINSKFHYPYARRPLEEYLLEKKECQQLSEDIVRALLDGKESLYKGLQRGKNN